MLLLLSLLACKGDTDTGELIFTTDAIPPAAGELSSEPLDCTGAYELPAQLVGAQGLGYHDLEWEDLTFDRSWGLANRFENAWISDDEDSAPSVRVRPWLVPEAGECYRQGLAPGPGGELLGPVLGHATAFSHPDTAYDALARDVYTPPGYDLRSTAVLVQALRGLHGLDNAWPGAPEVDAWTEADTDALVASTEAWPRALSLALAELVLAVGEAHLLRETALAEADRDQVLDLHAQFMDEDYVTLNTAMISPSQRSAIEDTTAIGEVVDLRSLMGAGLAVGAAADAVRLAAAEAGPFESEGIDVLTPHGRVLVDTTVVSSTWTADQLADAAVVVDLGGDDTWEGRYAATHQAWMAAAVVVDAAGSDLYTPETPDITDPETSARRAFDTGVGFTQGAGLFGVGVLVDGGGDDTYTSSVYAQGTGAFGVGLLLDAGGADTYRLGASGQGAGYFGVGLHIDRDGDDHYGLYTTGMGAGKPMGHGLLLDLDGRDTYISYHAEHEPGLPGPSYNNYFGLDTSWPYSDEDEPHYMSVSQGVGWGYRGDWFSDMTNWMGGFGALVDLGDGDDVHYGDCMTMGQGFVYGFGYLYDGGGDDLYHTFWWGPAASAHMGVSLHVEEDGDDDFHVGRLSGGYGYDWSVGWVLDHGGDDTYGGQFNYGRGYTQGMTFMINVGGDDVYNADLAQGSPAFGIVDSGHATTRLVGAFLDLGGGSDTYNTGYEEVMNDATWYLEPVGSGTNPNAHKGIGIDE